VLASAMWWPLRCAGLHDVLASAMWWPCDVVAVRCDGLCDV